MSKGDKKNIILERRKPKKNQKENLVAVDGRDTFQTPNYATELLIPFLARLTRVSTIWECAAGQGKIVNRLALDGFDVYGTDLDGIYYPKKNFLTDMPSFHFDCIVTNTPFSLKRKFYERCRNYNTPFALLVPADYSGWIINAVNHDGAEKIIPTRRIDYITPNTLQRIWEGETWDRFEHKGNLELPEFKEYYGDAWERLLDESRDEFCFESIYTAPSNLLRKYSSSYFHSMWLTRGFGLGRSETFVELTNEMKDNI